MPQTWAAHLFNLSAIPREGNSPLYVEFYAGDILSVHSDALIISTFTGDYFPVPGSIQGALKERFDIEYGAILPPGAQSVHPNLHRFPTPRCEAFNHLWMIEVRDVEDMNRVTVGEIARTFCILQKHVGDIVQNDVKSISLPLIGTGYLGLPLQEVIWETLKLMKRWADTAPTLEFVRVFAYDAEKFATLNLTIDRIQGFDSDESTNLLLKAAKEELSQKLGSFCNQSVTKSLERIMYMAGTNQPSAKSIALEGRRLAEACTKLLFVHFKPESKLPDKLNDLIGELTPSIKETGQAWITTYFRLLQWCGNSSAHDSVAHVNLIDAAAVVVAALRAAEFTQIQTAK